jgi:hypothetical protein
MMWVFHADPTFHFDADPDLDQSLHFDADPNPDRDPTRIFIHVGRKSLKLLFTAMLVYIVSSFSSVSKMS